MHHGNFVHQPCIVDIETGYKECSDQSDAKLVDALWYGTIQETRRPSIVVRSTEGGNVLLEPQAEGASGQETKHWKCVTTASQNFQGGGAWRLRHLLSSHKLQTLSFSSDRKFEQFLVRCEDLDLASRLLIDAGFAVGPTGPTDRASSVSKGEGAWRVESGPKLEDLQAVCSSPHLFRLEAEVSGRKIYVQVCSRLESGALVEASSAGELLKEAESITLAKTSTSSDSSDSSAHWTRLAERCTVVLELCDNPEKLVGYWLFASSGLFALILSPRSCAAARYEGPVGQAAQLELHSLSHAILGQVERPGLLKVLRSAWSEAESQPGVFYDASSDAGTIEVDEEEKLLVQRHEDGSELRWHILRMDENPFAGAASDPCGACDGSDAEANQNQDDIRSSPGRSRSRRRTMKSEEEPTEVTKESVKEKKKVKKDKVPFKAEKEKKEKGERKDRREREDLERERERQKARERAREAERNDRAREREGREAREGREGREKERESREKPKRHLERSHAFDKPGLPAGQPPVRTAAPAQISQALPSQANASALLAAINQASQGHEHNPEVETFLSMNSVELHAATKLRGLPRHLQRQVLDRGSLMGARDPSAVLISRVRDAMMSSAMTTMPSMPILTMTLSNGQQVHPAVEALIIRFGLDAQCAQQLRQLPLQLQAVAAELPVHEARNPSAFVMAQLQLPRFKQAAKAMMQRT